MRAVRAVRVRAEEEESKQGLVLVCAQNWKKLKNS